MRENFKLIIFKGMNTNTVFQKSAIFKIY